MDIRKDAGLGITRSMGSIHVAARSAGFLGCGFVHRNPDATGASSCASAGVGVGVSVGVDTRAGMRTKRVRPIGDRTSRQRSVGLQAGVPCEGGGGMPRLRVRARGTQGRASSRIRAMKPWASPRLASISIRKRSAVASIRTRAGVAAPGVAAHAAILPPAGPTPSAGRNRRRAGWHVCAQRQPHLQTHSRSPGRELSRGAWPPGGDDRTAVPLPRTR